MSGRASVSANQKTKGKNAGKPNKSKSTKRPFLGATRGFILLCWVKAVCYVALARTKAGHLGFLKGKPEEIDDGDNKRTAAREMDEEANIKMPNVRVVPAHEFHELNEKGNLSVACWMAVMCRDDDTPVKELPKLQPRADDEVTAEWMAVDQALVSPHLRRARQLVLTDALALALEFDLSNTATVAATLPRGDVWLMAGPDADTTEHIQAQPFQEDDPATELAAEQSRVSHFLSKVLRHKAVEMGLKVRPDGCVRVTDLLALQPLRRVTLEQLREVVRTNDKQRFSFDSTGKFLRANQGHDKVVASQINDDLIATKILEPLPVCVHGTYRDVIGAIEKEGLKCMGRDWIHFAAGMPGEVISGMRTSAQVLIYVDMAKAMADGIVFRMSANGVIETRGTNDTLHPKYFSRVVHV